MTVENQIRMLAGTFVMASVALSQLHSPYWLIFTAFVGFNLFQSSITHFCPAEMLFRKLKGGQADCCKDKEPAAKSCCGGK